MIEKCKAVCCKVWDKIKAGWNWIVSKIQQVIYGPKNF